MDDTDIVTRLKERRFPDLEGVPEPLRCVIRKCWTKEGYTAREALRDMGVSFFSGLIDVLPRLRDSLTLTYVTEHHASLHMKTNYIVPASIICLAVGSLAVFLWKTKFQRTLWALFILARYVKASMQSKTSTHLGYSVMTDVYYVIGKSWGYHKSRISNKAIEMKIQMA